MLLVDGPPCASAARELGAERVEPLLPELPEPGDPVLDLTERLGVERVEASRPLGAHGREPARAQDPQVLGDGRLADGELLPHERDDLARGPLTLGEVLEDAAADGVAQDVERFHLSTMGAATYISQALCDRIAE